MDRNQLSTEVQHAMGSQEPQGPSRCPVCGGTLVPLRDRLRCTLCCFVLCEGCEGGAAEGWPTPLISS
jgi:hypothetical protein